MKFWKVPKNEKKKMLKHSPLSFEYLHDAMWWTAAKLIHHVHSYAGISSGNMLEPNYIEEKSAQPTLLHKDDKTKPQTSNCGLELIKFDSFISSLGKKKKKKVANSRKSSVAASVQEMPVSLFQVWRGIITHQQIGFLFSNTSDAGCSSRELHSIDGGHLVVAVTHASVTATRRAGEEN